MRTIAITRRSRLALLAVLCAVGVLATACQGSSGDEPGDGASQQLLSSGHDDGPRIPDTGGRLVVAVPAESNGWNPFIDQWADSGTLVGSSMIESLAVQDNDGKAQPWLAEKWEPNEDFTEWTISLRPSVFFHDDTRLDAEAAKKSIDASFQSGLYKVALENLYDRVEVIDELTLRAHLKVSWAAYPTHLANEWILSPNMLDREDGGVLDPVGTGPFRFERWEQGQSLTARRFDRYWRKDDHGKQLPYLNAVEFRVIPDDSEREQAMRTGEVDLALSATSAIADRIKDEYTLIKDYTGQRTFLMLNTEVGTPNKGNPFVNVHARRALAYATDRKRVAEQIGDGVQSTSHGFRPDSPWAPSGDDGYFPYDQAKARKEIELYKTQTGASRLSFTLNGITAREAQQTLQLLKGMWEEVGIKVTIDFLEPPKLTVLAALGHYHASWFRLFDFPDPDQMNFYWRSDNVNPVGELSVNFTHYKSRQLDENLRIVREELDMAKRKAASDAIVRETNNQVLSLWLYDTPASLVARKKVEGLDGFRSHGFANNLPKPWLAETWLAR